MKKEITILVNTDTQVDFMYGSLGSEEARAVIKNIVKLNKKVKAENPDNVVIFTKDTHYSDYLETQEGKNLPVEHCKRDTEGWEIIEELREIYDEEDVYVIMKYAFGSMDLMELIKYLIKTEYVVKIIFCGVCTDICVVSNVLITKAAFPELEVIVYEDCCAGVTPELHKAAIAVMRSCQVKIMRINRDVE